MPSLCIVGPNATEICPAPTLILRRFHILFLVEECSQPNQFHQTCPKGDIALFYHFASTQLIRAAKCVFRNSRRNMTREPSGCRMEQEMRSYGKMPAGHEKLFCEVCLFEEEISIFRRLVQCI